MIYIIETKNVSIFTENNSQTNLTLNYVFPTFIRRIKLFRNNEHLYIWYHHRFFRFSHIIFEYFDWPKHVQLTGRYDVAERLVSNIW